MASGALPTLGGIESARQRWRADGFLAGRTLAEALAEGAAAHPDTPIEWASAERPASATVGEVAAEGRRLGAALAQAGLRAGDVVACQLPNWREAAVVVQAVFGSGMVLLPLVPGSGSAELRHILTESRARAIVLPATWRRTDYVAQLEAALPLPTLEHVIVVGGDREHRHVRWEELLEGAEAAPSATPTAVRSSPDDACLVIYTSGSSAKPKGVVHTHDSVLASTRLSYEFAPQGAARFAPNPSGHMGALMALLDAMIFGTRVVFMDAWDPDEAVRICARIEPGFMPASTPFLQMLLDAEERAAPEPPAWPRSVGVGGTTVPRELLERMEASGRLAFRMYGSSEVPVATSGRFSDPFETRAGTDGHPTLGGRVAIVGPDGDPLAPGQQGEVLLQSPQMFRGYVDPTLDAECLTTDGWFRTGDLGVLGDDGTLTITGRVKDIVIRGGENISAPEVEAIVVAHPAVHEVAVVGLPDERLGERACCNIRLAPGHDGLGLDQLQAWFRERGVAIHKTPERVVIWERDFPRSTEGKVKKSAVRSTVLDAGPTAVRIA